MTWQYFDSQEDKMGMWKMRNAYKILVKKIYREASTWKTTNLIMKYILWRYFEACKPQERKGGGNCWHCHFYELNQHECSLFTNTDLCHLPSKIK
jgi:hypothetical protein